MKKNQEHLHNIETDISTITVIQTARQNRPKGLKRPYEYVLSLAKAKALCNDLKKYLKTKESNRKVYTGFQCAGVSTKAITKGIRFGVFLLGYHNDNPNNHNDGHVSEQEWNETCQYVQKLLFDTLGNDARMYIDDYTKKDKFQAMFDTYIAYEELL